jgi:hypothetical protein
MVNSDFPKDYILASIPPHTAAQIIDESGTNRYHLWYNVFETAVNSKARGGEWRKATTRILICVAAYPSTNNWDQEPVHLSLKNKVISFSLGSSHCRCFTF